MATIYFTDGSGVTIKDSLQFTQLGNGNIEFKKPDGGNFIGVLTSSGTFVAFNNADVSRFSPLPRAMSKEEALKITLANIHQFEGWNEGSEVRKLKKILEKFDARKKRWKNK